MSEKISLDSSVKKYLMRRLVTVLHLKLVRSILIKLNLKQLLQEI